MAVTAYWSIIPHSSLQLGHQCLFHGVGRSQVKSLGFRPQLEECPRGIVEVASRGRRLRPALLVPALDLILEDIHYADGDAQMGLFNDRVKDRVLDEGIIIALILLQHNLVTDIRPVDEVNAPVVM